MDYKRVVLYLVLGFVLLQLWHAWQHDFPQTVSSVTPAVVSGGSRDTEQAASNLEDNSAVPNLGALSGGTGKATGVKPPAHVKVPSDRLVHINTDVLQLTLDRAGGNIVRLSLPKYPESIKDKTPFLLLNTKPGTQYLAQSGLTGQRGPDMPGKAALYQTEQSNYTMLPEQNELTVDLNYTKNGVVFTKRFVFKRGQYLVNVNYQIQNKASQDWAGHLFTQIQRKEITPDTKGMFRSVTYLGGAVSTPEKLFQKVTFKDMRKENLDLTAKGGWVSMVQHYFLSAWIPDNAYEHHFYSSVNQQGLYTLGMYGPEITVSAGKEKNISTQFYAGPEITKVLKGIAPGLDQTIDYGIFWWISSAIFWLMATIHGFVGNWGWSIVLVTLVIKLAFYKLSATSYRSMGKMRQLQPRITALKERLAEDKQAFSKALMELYRKEKVNPMGGCLPILIQIPVFLGLYWVLIESVELRQAPFIFWIHDLSVKDPFYVLPVLMGLTMFLQQRMSPPPPDPTQAKVMMFLPIVFTGLFMSFPAGLVLYWFVNNGLSIIQQWYVTRELEKEIKKKKAKR